MNRLKQKAGMNRSPLESITKELQNINGNGENLIDQIIKIQSNYNIVFKFYMTNVITSDKETDFLEASATIQGNLFIFYDNYDAFKLFFSDFRLICFIL